MKDSELKEALLKLVDDDGVIRNLHKQPQAKERLKDLSKQAKRKELKKNDTVDDGFGTRFFKQKIFELTGHQYRVQGDDTFEEIHEQLIKHKTDDGFIGDVKTDDPIFYGKLRRIAETINKQSGIKGLKDSDIMKSLVYAQTGLQYKGKRFVGDDQFLSIVSRYATDDGCIDELRTDANAFKHFNRKVTESEMTLYDYAKSNGYYFSKGEIPMDIEKLAKHLLAKRYPNKVCVGIWKDEKLYRLLVDVRRYTPEYSKGNIADMLSTWGFEYDPVNQNRKSLITEQSVHEMAEEYLDENGVLQPTKNRDLQWGMTLVASSKDKSISELGEEWETPIYNRTNKTLESKRLTGVRYESVEELRELEKIKAILEKQEQARIKKDDR